MAVPDPSSKSHAATRLEAIALWTFASCDFAAAMRPLSRPALRLAMTIDDMTPIIPIAIINSINVKARACEASIIDLQYHAQSSRHALLWIEA